MTTHTTIDLGPDGLGLVESDLNDPGTPGGWLRIHHRTGAVVFHTPDLAQLADDLQELAELAADLAELERGRAEPCAVAPCEACTARAARGLTGIQR